MSDRRKGPDGVCLWASCTLRISIIPVKRDAVRVDGPAYIW
jgi:hypothetical protein